nr:MAG TPA: hypothetical protein [Caudoviricetes sp.]
MNFPRFCRLVVYAQESITNFISDIILYIISAVNPEI